MPDASKDSNLANGAGPFSHASSGGKWVLEASLREGCVPLGIYLFLDTFQPRKGAPEGSFTLISFSIANPSAPFQPQSTPKYFITAVPHSANLLEYLNALFLQPLLGLRSNTGFTTEFVGVGDGEANEVRFWPFLQETLGDHPHLRALFSILAGKSISSADRYYELEKGISNEDFRRLWAACQSENPPPREPRKSITWPTQPIKYPEHLEFLAPAGELFLSHLIGVSLTTSHVLYLLRIPRYASCVLRETGKVFNLHIVHSSPVDALSDRITALTGEYSTRIVSSHEEGSTRRFIFELPLPPRADLGHVKITKDTSVPTGAEAHLYIIEIGRF